MINSKDNAAGLLAIVIVYLCSGLVLIAASQPSLAAEIVALDVVKSLDHVLPLLKVGSVVGILPSLD